MLSSLRTLFARLPARLLASALLVTPSLTLAADTAALFETARSAVLQIRVLDQASNDKVAIGSGFVVAEDGRIITNFHVVSDYVHAPDKFSLEFVDARGRTGPLTVSALDVVHDLALLRGEGDGVPGLALAQQPLAQGDRIFAMGNPHDLGLTIIEGTYNGNLANTRFAKILFSGSLNPGMSGGPAFDARGQIIGVNVATGGDDISFLVPVDHARALLGASEDLAPAAFPDAIASDLGAEQRAFFASVNAVPTKVALGPWQVPGRLSPSLRCWGHSVDEDDGEIYEATHRHCEIEDVIYVSEALMLGHFAYDYEWLRAGRLNPFQFRTLLEERFDLSDNEGHGNGGADPSSWACRDAFLKLAPGRFKTVACQRPVEGIERLYDFQLLAVSLDDPKEALLTRVTASGIGAPELAALARLFLGGIE